MYVKELDLFVTVRLLDDTPAVLSLGKLCQDQGYSYGWTTGQKPQLTNDVRLKECNTANFVLIDKVFKLSYTYISYISIAGSRASTRNRKNKKK